MRSDMRSEDDISAEKKYNKYKSLDPFPHITPALLNSADVIDYVLTTGMICPFYISTDPEESKLKPASYGIALLGKCVYFENEEPVVKDIRRGDQFILRKNSIAFATLEPYFRIPDYIALRFNLKIKNVYRGILLGTGPLVDPGFEGYLSIPLHNLTVNDYTFVGGEDLVYFEFTKLSPNKLWDSGTKCIEAQKGVYISFPQRKKLREDIESYLLHASPYRAIRSSIPDAIRTAETSAKNAERSATEAATNAGAIEKTIRKWSFWGIIAVLLGLAGLLIPTWTLVYITYDYLRNSKNDSRSLSSYANKTDEIDTKLILLKSQIDSLMSLQKNHKILQK